jgi:hypothetical protein
MMIIGLISLFVIVLVLLDILGAPAAFEPVRLRRPNHRRR